MSISHLPGFTPCSMPFALCLNPANMKNPYFNADSYTTDLNTQRYFFDRLMVCSRLPFAYKYLACIFRYRKIALKGMYNTKAWADSSMDILKIVEKVGGRFHISGFENLENLDEPVVYISNHMSTLETMVFPGLIAPFGEVTFVVKDSIEKNPIFGPIMRARNPISVGRSNSREDLMKVIKDGKEKLKNGTSVVIFPQSTRTVEMVPEKFNSLGVKLAAKAKVKVVPVAIKTDMWGNGKYIKELGKMDRKKPIYIKFGKPMEVKGNGKEQHEKIIEFISENLAKWNQE